MKYLALFFFLLTPCYAVKTVDAGPIHEAFVPPTAGNVILEAVADAPPNKVQEGQPYKQDQNTEWIEGYWAWAPEQGGYVWVSGVFRLSPPGRQWVPGFWEQMSEGWVWIAGFWHDRNESQISYINQAPPNPVEPSVSEAPNNSFWMPGYWQYSKDDGNFDWLEGRWQKFDSNWVYTPAHYAWRPDGYIFVSGYWDYPLEDRGTVYASVLMEGESSYTPSVVLSDNDIVIRLFPYYPNYLCFFQYHYHYHMPWWRTFWGTPPWWGWGVWWTFTWQNQWGVWWWWGHPGFPQPVWLTLAMSEKIEPPGERLVQRMKRLEPPAIVTPKGVVAPSRLIKQLGENPILPAASRRRLRAIRRAQPKDSGRIEVLKPTGVGTLGEGPRPDIKPDQQVPPGKTVRPPMVPSTKRPIPPIRPAQPARPVPRPREEVRPAPRQPERVQPRPQQRRPHPYWPETQPPPSPARPPRAQPRPRRPSETQPYPSQPRPRPSEIQPYPSQPRPSQTQPSEIQSPRLRQRPGRGNNES